MAKIDIISKINLTTDDGGAVLSGATIKFSSLFHSGSNDIEISLEIYRSREIMELGFSSLKIKEIPNRFKLIINDDDFPTITPLVVYEMVKNKLNEFMEDDVFEIHITNDSE